jgi:hypothetical protein
MADFILTTPWLYDASWLLMQGALPPSGRRPLPLAAGLCGSVTVRSDGAVRL